MSWRHTKAAGELAIREPSQKAVLLALAHHANEYSGQCWPGIKRLALFTGLGERTVQVALRALEDAGLVATRPRPNATSVYTLLLPGEQSVDQHDGVVQQLHQGGAATAPKPSMKDAKDAPANDDPLENWCPHPETVARIVADEGLTIDEVEGERQMFILTNQEKGNVPKNIETAFRRWCARLKTLSRPPRSAAPARARAAARADLPTQIRNLEGLIVTYRKMGRSYEIETELEPKLRLLKTQLESQPKETTHGPERTQAERT
jgi:hypothetical protein